MGGIGSAVAVGGMFGKDLRDSLEVFRRNYTIAVKENEVVSLGAFHTVVASDGTPFIVFMKVLDIETGGTSIFTLPTAWYR